VTQLPPQDPDSWRRFLQPKYMLLAMMAVLILGSWLDKRYPELFQMSLWLEHLGLGEFKR
jgi:hypothetical protein